jgi:Zn-dependent M28 family amino/carboxypeptidase
MLRYHSLVFVLISFTIGLFIDAHAGSKSCSSRVNNTHKKLLECVTLEGVRHHQATFQQIADNNGGIRTSGTSGYDESVYYIASSLEEAGYDVTVQPSQHVGFINLGGSVFKQTSPGSIPYIENSDYTIMSYSAPGNVMASVTPVGISLGLGNTPTSGCEASDFASFPAGQIALIQRDVCSFQIKAQNAAAAGAVGVIIFNQGNTIYRQGLITGTLSADYTGGIPVIFTTYGIGEALSLISGPVVSLDVKVFSGIIDSANIIAESQRGDASNVVMAGSHLDSVSTGPGIQDNGSGSAALLETALQMAKVKPKNKVRFAWWGSEEFGLLGSTYYLNNMVQNELSDIALYLNFDMIAFPNYVFFILDGDNSDGIGAGPGPDGSAAIETLFKNYYQAKGYPVKGSDFSGRSDYGPFIQAGIPAGGIFTGAEGIKTLDEAVLWGGTAGEQYDPCYHLACDTYDNVSLEALDINSNAVAFSVLQFAMDTNIINGKKGKGNFKRTYDLNYLGSQLQK